VYPTETATAPTCVLSSGSGAVFALGAVHRSRSDGAPADGKLKLMIFSWLVIFTILEKYERQLGRMTSHILWETIFFV